MVDEEIKKEIEMRTKEHAKLCCKIKFFNSEHPIGDKFKGAASGILEVHEPNDDCDSSELLRTAKSLIPKFAETLACTQLHNIMFQVSILRGVLKLHYASTNITKYLFSLNIQKPDDLYRSVKSLLWLGSLYEIPSAQMSKLWKGHCKLFVISDDEFRTILETVRKERCSGLTKEINDDLDAKIKNIADNISNLNSRINRITDKPINTTDIELRPSYQYSNREIRNAPHRRYTSIEAIPELPESRERAEVNGRSNIAGLMKAFSHPQSMFSGTGDVSENFGSYHQSYVNLCRKFHLTQNEAYDNLYILFKTNSEAGKYYHKHVLLNGRSLDEAFGIMYSRFISAERRDRLIQKGNNLKFKNLMADPGKITMTLSENLVQPLLRSNYS